jgi:hypothetical protein
VWRTLSEGGAEIVAWRWESVFWENKLIGRFLVSLVRAALLFACVISMAACDAAAKRGSNALTIYGYNYTDLYIDSFSINGQGGGDLAVSNHGAGGGRHVCCVGLNPRSKPPIPVTIKWRRDNSTIWCEQEVMLEGPIPPDPHYFEVHFHPDGHVEVAVTKHASLPRLEMEQFSPLQRKERGNVVNDAKFAKCNDSAGQEK